MKNINPKIKWLTYLILSINLGIFVIYFTVFAKDDLMIELESYPDSYPIDMALQNNDIIIGPYGKPINIDRFYEFLKNVDNSKKDKITIARYTFEGEPEEPWIGILYFDGKEIRFIVDIKRIAPVTESKYIYDYRGDKIESKESLYMGGAEKYVTYYLVNSKLQKRHSIISFFI